MWRKKSISCFWLRSWTVKLNAYGRWYSRECGDQEMGFRHGGTQPCLGSNATMANAWSAAMRRGRGAWVSRNSMTKTIFFFLGWGGVGWGGFVNLNNEYFWGGKTWRPINSPFSIKKTKPSVWGVDLWTRGKKPWLLSPVSSVRPSSVQMQFHCC